MSDGPLGVIEIILAFGAVLGLAVWELVRNRRALDRMRDGNEPDRR